MKIITLLFILANCPLLQSCVLSKTVSPKVTGYVFDKATKTPIADCNVNGITTDSTGYYAFKEIRIRGFFGIYQVHSLDVEVLTEKNGYISDTLKRRAPYGGYSKGAHWEMDTLFLNRHPQNEPFRVEKSKLIENGQQWDIIPDGWQLLSSAWCDLNKDGIDDWVIAIEQPDSLPYLRIDSILVKERILAVYFVDSSDKYSKQLHNTDFIYLMDSLDMEEAYCQFDGECKQEFSISFHLTYNPNQFLQSYLKYTFNYINNDFYLTAYEHFSLDENGHNEIKMDFQNKLLHLSDRYDGPIKTTSFKLDDMKTLNEMGGVLSWEFEGYKL